MLLEKNRLLVGIGCGLFLIFLTLYCQTAYQGMIPYSDATGDSAELQRVANRLGVAHSTGYPLFTIMGYGFARIGEALGANPYTWITYVSAVWGAGGIALFFLLLARVFNPLTAFLGAVLLAVTNNYWHISTITEVQALNGWIVIGILGGAVNYSRKPSQFKWLVMLALWVGLALANHRLALLILPTLIFVVFRRELWGQITLKRVLWLGMAVLLPLMSYLYIMIRLSDPFVVTSIKPNWIAGDYSLKMALELILGTQSGGQGTFGAITLPIADFSERFAFAWDVLMGELPAWAVILGVVGLLLMVRWDWRVALMLIASGVIWLVFMMSWRLDTKGIIYYFPLVIVLIIGLIFLGNPALYLKRTLPVWVMVVVALPLVYWIATLYTQNKPVRDLSNDHQGLFSYQQISNLPKDVRVWNRLWSPENFILLEALQAQGREDVVLEASDFPLAPVADMHDMEKIVLIGPTLRGTYGLYNGQTWFQEEQQIALAGTQSPLFLQAYAQGANIFETEADQANIIRFAINDQIELYSYQYDMRSDGLYLTLYWRAHEAVTVNHSVYTHIREYDVMCDLDTVRRVVAQSDAFAPVQSTYPVMLWEVDVFVKDTYLIPILLEQISEMDNIGLVIGMTDAHGERQQEFCVPLAVMPS